MFKTKLIASLLLVQFFISLSSWAESSNITKLVFHDQLDDVPYDLIDLKEMEINLFPNELLIKITLKSLPNRVLAKRKEEAFVLYSVS